MRVEAEFGSDSNLTSFCNALQDLDIGFDMDPFERLVVVPTQSQDEQDIVDLATEHGAEMTIITGE